MTHRLCKRGPWGRGENTVCRAEPKGKARPCQYRSALWEPCIDLAPPIHGAEVRNPGLFENGDRAGPAGRSGPHLDRKTAHPEAGRRQAFQIVQLLEMAIADLAAGLVTLPDQARVASLGK